VKQNRFIAVRQFDGSAKLLKVDLSSGAYELLSSEGVGEEEITFGLFEIEENNLSPKFIAVIATPEGPKLISDGMLYRPDIASTTAVIIDDSTKSIFRILHEGSPIFEMPYSEKWGIGLHPFARNREDVDLYFWLKGHIDSPDFYLAYTREIVYLESQ